MTSHVKRNMLVAGQYRPRPSNRTVTLRSGTTVQLKGDLDQVQVLTMLAEQTAEANRRQSMRPGAMLAFVKHKRFPTIKFPDVLARARQRIAPVRHSIDHYQACLCVRCCYAWCTVRGCRYTSSHRCPRWVV